jgi:predicted HTH domain antitoxin
MVARAENLFAVEAPMPLVIPDELLLEAGLDEHEALVEIACRLFEGGKLTLWSAVKFAGMSRTEFEDELRSRQIAVYRPGLDELADDLTVLNRLGI